MSDLKVDKMVTDDLKDGTALTAQLMPDPYEDDSDDKDKQSDD